MMGVQNGIGIYRNLITRVSMLFYLIVLLWRWNAHLLPYQLLSPPVTLASMNATFWLYKLSGLQHILVDNKYGAIVFTLLLVLFCVLVFVFPKSRLSLASLILLFFVYGLIYPVNMGFASHYLAGILTFNFLFLSKSKRSFELLWEGLRYYTCWLYLSAFLWKFINGSFFQADFGEVVFKKNLSWFLSQQTADFAGRFYTFILDHKFILNWGDKLTFLLEGIFILGFFTKRYDKLLFALIILIHTLTYIFADALFFEVFILSLTLLSFNQWTGFCTAFPFMNKEFGKSEKIKINAG